MPMGDSIEKQLGVKDYRYRQVGHLTLYQTRKFYTGQAFADNKINVTQKLVLGTVMCRVKRRKCWVPALSPFPTMVSKGFFKRIVKSRDCVVKS